jgi:hypothetical protein
MRDTHSHHSDKSSDTWLTPPDLLHLLGEFDTDPCCPNSRMPWRTAKRMVKEKEDGLSVNWRGRVWLNPPYSNALPWIERMIEHNNGIALVYAKSTDARWGQLALKCASLAYFMAGRLLFFYPDGSESTGKWCSNMLLSFGKNNDKYLWALSASSKYKGVLMKNASNLDGILSNAKKRHSLVLEVNRADK